MMFCDDDLRNITDMMDISVQKYWQVVVTSLGESLILQNQAFFWEDLHNLSEMSVHKLAQFDLSCQHLLSKSILFVSFIQLHNLKVFVHVKGFHNSVCAIKMQGIYFWKRSAGQQMINVQHGKFHTQIFYNGKREKSPT